MQNISGAGGFGMHLPIRPHDSWRGSATQEEEVSYGETLRKTPGKPHRRVSPRRLFLRPWHFPGCLRVRSHEEKPPSEPEADEDEEEEALQPERHIRKTSQFVRLSTQTFPSIPFANTTHSPFEELQELRARIPSGRPAPPLFPQTVSLATPQVGGEYLANMIQRDLVRRLHLPQTSNRPAKARSRDDELSERTPPGKAGPTRGEAPEHTSPSSSPVAVLPPLPSYVSHGQPLRNDFHCRASLADFAAGPAGAE